MEIYLEMQLDFLHLDSHKLGLYLKVSDFFTGADIKHDILQPGNQKNGRA